jgi:hypothetical protein
MYMYMCDMCLTHHARLESILKAPTTNLRQKPRLDVAVQA